MKIAIDPRKLRAAVSRARRALPRYPDKAADECIAICACANYGSVSVYAEGKYFRTVIQLSDATIKEDGFVTVMGKKLEKVLKAFEQPVSISGPCATDSGVKEVILSSDGCEYALPHIDTDMQHLFLPGLSTPAIGELDAEIISRVIYAVAPDDDNRAMLQGIRFSGGEIVSTNGQRLACYKFPLPTTVTIHSSVLKEVSELGTTIIRAARDGDTIEEIIFTSQNIGIASKPIAGNYPNHHIIMPAEGFAYQIKIKRWPLLRALTGAAAICGQDTHVVRMTFSDEVVISTKDPDYGRMVETIPLDTPVHDLQEAFHFSVWYLIDAISRFKSKEVIINLNEPKSVAMLQDGDYGYCFVMPIRHEERR